jgi:hemolysin activation/secretion protein
MPFIKTMYLRYGLYATIFYDIGTVWEKSESIKKKQFLSGTGVGLNLLLPFDYIVRLDWGFRLHKPIVGQLVLSLSAKF